jgi:hypothetical protein
MYPKLIYCMLKKQPARSYDEILREAYKEIIDAEDLDIGKSHFMSVEHRAKAEAERRWKIEQETTSEMGMIMVASSKEEEKMRKKYEAKSSFIRWASSE